MFYSRLIFSGLILLCIPFVATAQKYRTAAGLRIEREAFGLTVQQKLFERTTLEGIGSVRSNEVSATALLEYHTPFLGKRLNTYGGIGAHVGHLKDHGGFYGGDLILGIEYKLNFFPILVSADVKPAFHVNHTDWFNFGGGVSVRYVLVKDKKKPVNWWPFGKKEEEKKSIWPFKRKEEEKKKPLWPFKKEEEKKEEKKFRLFPERE